MLLVGDTLGESLLWSERKQGMGSSRCGRLWRGSDCRYKFWKGFRDGDFFFYSFLKLVGSQGVWHSPQAGETGDRWDQFPQPANKLTLSPAPGKAFMPQRVSLAVPSSTLSWNSQLSCLPMPCWGTWLTSKSRETLSIKALCPLAAHRTGALLCSGFKHQVRIPEGCCLPSGWHNVAVGSALSMIPTQRDKVLPSPLGLVLFGDKFLFSQHVTHEETQDQTSGLAGLSKLIKCRSVHLTDGKL